MSAQVWNVNACGGCVGVFNLQGAAWDRKRRQFFQHDARPPALEALVCPADVEAFSAGCDPRAHPGGRPAPPTPDAAAPASSNSSGSNTSAQAANAAATASSNGNGSCASHGSGSGAQSSSSNGSAAAPGPSTSEAGAAEPTWAALSSAAPGELMRLRANEGMLVRLEGAPFVLSAAYAAQVHRCAACQRQCWGVDKFLTSF